MALTAFPTSGACLPARRPARGPEAPPHPRPCFAASTALEMLGQAVRDKARALSIHVTVAKAALTMREEALRNHQMRLVLGPGHGDIEQPTLFFNFGR